MRLQAKHHGEQIWRVLWALEEGEGEMETGKEGVEDFREEDEEREEESTKDNMEKMKLEGAEEGWNEGRGKG